ncbi:hypothetical protein JKP88DRAFT_203130 [Tribonema minus]|uniref:Uncharacterized protein n=1 Tax=Tribonema minus TaxID=303371 RepID=A0A835YIN5_9STRA|nr:hypothetical protein JKP88DRAFT_203130 [Tribonema minus]
MASGLYEPDRVWLGSRLLNSLLFLFRWLTPWVRRTPSLAGGGGGRPKATRIPAAPYVSRARPRVAPRLVPAPMRSTAGLYKADLIEEAGPKLDERPSDDAPIPVTGKALSWMLAQIIYKRALRVEGLDLLVQAASNRKALSGNLKTVWCKFRTLALPAIQITGGANMVVTGVDLKMLLLMHRRLGAFKKPFQVRGEWVFTSNDFVASNAIRNMVQAILTASFNALSLGAVRVTRVSIKGDRIVIDARSSVLQRFSCSANLATSSDGHVVSLRSLRYSNQAGEFLFQTPWQLAATLPRDLVSCDMGDNTRIEALTIRNGRATLRGCFVVTPTPPLIVADVGKRGMVRYDVGERISAIVSDVLDNALTWRTVKFWG